MREMNLLLPAWLLQIRKMPLLALVIGPSLILGTHLCAEAQVSEEAAGQETGESPPSPSDSPTEESAPDITAESDSQADAKKRKSKGTQRKRRKPSPKLQLLHFRAGPNLLLQFNDGVGGSIAGELHWNPKYRVRPRVYLLGHAGTFWVGGTSVQTVFDIGAGAGYRFSRLVAGEGLLTAQFWPNGGGLVLAPRLNANFTPRLRLGRFPLSFYGSYTPIYDSGSLTHGFAGGAGIQF